VQTKFVILASIFGVITGLCFSTNQNILLSVGTALIASTFGLVAYFSKDKKDKQIEEMHSEITSNNSSKPTETSTSIIESYMQTARQIEIDAYNSDVVALNRNLASRGLYSSGMAIMQIKELKLTHIKKFVTDCVEYAESTRNTYLLDKPKIKLLLQKYQAVDISDTASIIDSQFTARGLLVKQDMMPSVVSDIDNAYSIALLRIDTM